MPAVTLRLVGLALSEKSAGGGAVTTSVALAERASELLVPVTVNVVPLLTGVEADVVNVSVDVVPVAVVGFGLKLAVTPVGSVPMLKVTAPL